jgi:protein-disulfide isomerase
MKRSSQKSNRLGIFFGASLLAQLVAFPAIGFGDDTVAFKIDNRSVKVEDLFKNDQSAFFEIEKQKYDLIERMAHEQYLDFYWQQLAKKQSMSVEQAKSDYMKKNIKITDKEVAETIERFKEYPQLKKLSKEEQEKQVRGFLEQNKEQEVTGGIIAAATSKKELQIVYPKPQEPVFNIEVTANDPVRYGPEMSDVNPKGCKGNDCQITVVEYSEFQCPFCVRVLPTVKRLMSEYSGKARWIVRDFPLSFHDRARPAAVAAKCAQQQGKYWDMYAALFDNQKDLSDKAFDEAAKKAKLDQDKFKKCVSSPAAVNAMIDANFESGQKYGVTGTPAFFINGRRLSGALPYEKFKEIFDEELAKKSKKS